MSISRGQHLFAIGDEPSAVFGLESGLLDVAASVSGLGEGTVLRVGPGAWLGEVDLLAGVARETSVWAAVDSRVFRIPACAILQELAAHPESVKHFFKLSAVNANLALGSLAEMLMLSPRAHFARLLLRLAASDGSVRITQQELGRMTGMSRAAFRRYFSSLLQSGVVRTKYGAIQILDKATLEVAAELV